MPVQATDVQIIVRNYLPNQPQSDYEVANPLFDFNTGKLVDSITSTNSSCQLSETGPYSYRHAYRVSDSQN